MNYEIIKYKLDDLKYLASQFKQFGPQYISCVESVIKKTNDTYENTVTQFNSFLDKHGALDEANIKAYKEIYNSLKISEEIRESHLKGETVKAAAMVTNIISKLSLAHLNLESENIDSYILKAQLSNAKLLSETFEDVAPNYEGICREYINLIESLLSSAEFFMENDNFESFANTLLQAKKLLGIILGHLNLDSLNEKYHILLDKFVSSLKQRCENSIALLNKGCIEKNDIEILKTNITLIKSANDAHSLNFLISKLEIKELLQSIIIVYQQYFDKAKDDVISFINNEATYNVAEIEPKFDEFSLLMEIPDIEYLISASYQESLNSLINKISYFRKEAKEIVKSFINSPESIDLNHLRNCFSWLESGKWIEKFREGIYRNELSGIEKEIKSYIDKLLVELKEIDLGINFPFNVSQGYNIVKKLNPILQLKEFVPSLENYDKDIWIKFKERVEETLKVIKREFNPELQDIEKEKNDLKRLISIREEYLCYEEEKKEEILKIYGLENIEEIDTEINKIQNFIEIFSQKLEKNLFDIDKMENSYNYIVECRTIPELSEILEPFSSNIISILSQFYNKNLVSSKKCFDIITKNISDYRPWDITLIKKNSHQFSLSFKEILLLNTKSQSFFKFLEYQPHFDHYTNELNNLCTIFNEKLRNCIDKNELKKMSSLLAIANDFAKVNENFAAISIDYGKIQNSKQDQTCQNIIESIETYNFDRAIQLIRMLDEGAYNQNIDIIKEKVYCQIENLLKDLKENALNISNSKLDHAQISSTCSNFQKLATLKNNFYSFFDREVVQLFNEQEGNIRKIFMDKIMEFLYTIESAISSHKYYEAEVKMKNIQDLKSDLLKIYGWRIQDHLSKVQKKLDDMPHSILNLMRSCKIKDFKDCNPRLTLQEFENASNDFPKYKDSPSQVKNIIHEKFDSIRRTMLIKCSWWKKSIINDLSSILEILPSDFKNLANILIDDIKKNYKEHKKYTIEKINILAKGQNIKDLCAMYRKSVNKPSWNNNYWRETDYSQEINLSWEANYIEKSLRHILINLNDQICLAIDKGECEKVFKNAWVLEYKGKLNDIISDSEWILSEIEQSLKKVIANAFNSLLNIDHKDESIECIEALKCHTIFMDFKIKFEKEKGASNMFNFNNTIESMLVGISEFYANLNKSYLEFKPPNNAHSCNKILNKLKEWDEFFRIFKEYLSQYQIYHFYIDYERIKKLPRYSGLVEDLSEALCQLDDYFMNLKIQNDEIKHQKLLEDRANEIQDRLDQIKNFEDLKNHLNPHVANFEKIESGAINSISREMDKIVDDASHLINKDEIREEEFTKIRIYYNCLVMFEKNLKIKGFDWKKTLRGIEAKIFSKTVELREKAENGAQVAEIVDPMIKMKNISNNFPLLKEGLDKILDEFLETFRKKNKAKAVAIFEELEKHPSGLGLYILSEHKFFEGVMQRIWLNKTQRHDINYALDQIKGTNLNKEELEDKHRDYTEHFGELHRIYWRIASNEGADNAISQILSQIEIVSKNYAITSSNPDISLFKEFIPELLAYIAMLWVLLNIKKYNQDINDTEQEITIVTPHAIQILSIFRMIGIGYRENTNPKNNLVQILTGEGKSITLAFLCSMLALLGFSVNCACYSEHLSNRDFQDF
ncbi:unnamed protein product [Blepharisma stoltei]|uniref:Protein translocase subunit SecA n=1 Tax=Blepharisma stoltei TaxID=1481888 RepID=A0AAU9IQE2_9CILI|nr:unnamed protein product [Blepharisma stoltei]